MRVKSVPKRKRPFSYGKDEYKKKVRRDVVRNFSSAADTKYKVFSATSFEFNAFGDVRNIGNIDVGPDVTERIGRSVEYTSVRLRGVIYPTTNKDPCCLDLVYDSSPNQFLAAPGDICATYYDFPDRDNADRFKIIKHWDFLPIADTIHHTIVLNEYVRLPKGCIGQWTHGTTSGAIENQVKGGLYLLYRGMGAVESGNIGAIKVVVNFKEN